MVVEEFNQSHNEIINKPDTWTFWDSEIPKWYKAWKKIALAEKANQTATATVKTVESDDELPYPQASRAQAPTPQLCNAARPSVGPMHGSTLQGSGRCGCEENLESFAAHCVG